MTQMKYGLLHRAGELEFIEMPATHLYQLTALNRRLHKEINKLTAGNVPELPTLVAECEQVEVIEGQVPVTSGLDYLNRLEQTFAGIEEKAYPLLSLLTEIRALQAQIEHWYEEELEA